MRRPAVQWGCLIAVVILATALRVYDLKDLPAGLFCDEAALGYNAFAIGTSGVDENGQTLPLFVWSFGGYKNPIYIYAAAIPIRLFGLDEFTTRLPAALFGIGGIIGLFFAGRAVFNPWVGLFAALLLAVCPWHLHFSRIGFELISFPFLFTIGFTLLVRFTQGRRTLPLALFFCSLCIYAYAIATVFVPLFLLGFGLLYLPTMLRRWRETLIGIVVALATVAPAGLFYYRHPQGFQYLHNTAAVRDRVNLEAAARVFANNYREFFNPTFLFKSGDSISRHAVRGFGELLPSSMPLIVFGAIVCLLRRDRASKLILWWLALYPVGPSFMTEVPTASRSIIGAPAFCLLAGVGAAAALRALGWLARWRPLALAVQTAALGVAGYFLAPEFAKYWHAYVYDYPKYSAPTYGGFQYGYRESIQYMESQRANYDLLMLTAVEVNQPQIFPLFYNSMDARRWGKSPHSPTDLGYLILDPAEYSRYGMGQRILYQLHPGDLQMFTDYTVKHKVVAPNGQTEFVIAEVRARKHFLTEWLVLGLFDNTGGEGVNRNFIDVEHLSKKSYPGAFGEIYWRPITPQFVRVDLNRFFAAADPRHPGNPEEVCAYAALTVRSPQNQEAWLELAGSDDVAQVWLNGRSLTPGSLNLSEQPRRTQIALSGGSNLLVLKSCEAVGSWYFAARITDEQGRDLPTITTAPEIPAGPLPVATTAPAEMPQVIEGFADIVRFNHTQKVYPDYRGGTESWWAYVRDEQPEVVWHTAPVPAKQRTVMAFTASVSGEPGEAELYLNGEYVLTFQMNNKRGMETWERGGYHLTFVSKGDIAGNSGFMMFDVPADKVVPGQPMELRVMPSRAEDNAWFMVKNYRDTVTHEHVTPQLAVDTLSHPWTLQPEP